MAAVANQIGNTAAVCRSSYIDPRVVDRFEEGKSSRWQFRNWRHCGNRVAEVFYGWLKNRSSS
jgi:DNA topoisomerase IB